MILGAIKETRVLLYETASYFKHAKMGIAKKSVTLYPYSDMSYRSEKLKEIFIKLEGSYHSNLMNSGWR